MGLYVEFSVYDLGFIESTPNLGISPPYSEGCNVFVDTFLTVANELVPVDTGFLRSTLEADTDGFSCSAGTDCEYAEFVEYGTWCCGAQPYFEPAIEAAIDAAMPYWQFAEECAMDAENQAMAEFDKALNQGVALSLDQLVEIALAALAFAFMIIIMVITQEFMKDIFSVEKSGKNMTLIPDVIIT